VNNIAARIRRARVSARLTQSDLACFTGVRRSAVAQWEHPRGTHPTAEHMLVIAEKTGVNFEWLATGRGAPSSNSAVLPDELRDFAKNEFESRVLEAMRRLSRAKQELALKMVKLLAPD